MDSDGLLTLRLPEVFGVLKPNFQRLVAFLDDIKMFEVFKKVEWTVEIYHRLPKIL